MKWDMSRITDLFRPRRRGLHMQRVNVIRIVILAGVLAFVISGVVGFYELYRVKAVREETLEQAEQMRQSKKVAVLQLKEALDSGALLTGVYEQVYLDPEAVPEDRVSALNLSGSEYRARRPLSKGAILTRQDIVSLSEWLPDSVKLREFKNIIDIPELAQAGDVVDVILSRSSEDGKYEEYIVMSDKRIEYLNGSVIHFAMVDDKERYIMGRAVSEASHSANALIWLDKYPDAEIQGPARVTYSSIIENTDETESEIDKEKESMMKEKSEVMKDDSPTVSPSQEGQGRNDN